MPSLHSTTIAVREFGTPSSCSAHRAPLVVPKPFATAYLCVRELATKRPCLWLVTHLFPLPQQFLLCTAVYYWLTCGL